MKKYKAELEVVERFLAGDGGAKLPARHGSLPEEKVRTWGSHHRRHGIDGLRPERSAHGARFKVQGLAHQDREQLPSRQVTTAVHDIPNPHQVVAPFYCGADPMPNLGRVRVRFRGSEGACSWRGVAVVDGLVSSARAAVGNASA